MKNVTDRTSNPFGMRPPCDDAPADGPDAVYGYGDANADFHVVGDHPGIHGGTRSGVPFTGSVAGDRLQTALEEVGLIEVPDEAEPVVSNLFLSYLAMCRQPGDRPPTAAEYARLEPFFDAELRAIAAHVLLPVGPTATEHVLETYTAQAHKLDVAEMDRLHATEVRGSGFLVIPIREPAEWEDTDRDRLVARLRALLEGDYRQTTDLSRFLANDDLYMVR